MRTVVAAAFALAQLHAASQAPAAARRENVETFALSPDARKILTDMGHNLGVPQPANHMAAII